MRGEEGEKKEGGGPKDYFFRLCASCGKKLHIGARICPDQDCGGQPGGIIGSSDPGDAVYNTRLNSVEKCMKCYNVLQRGEPCSAAYCFGVGIGRCSACRRFDAPRHECCREIQAEDKEAGGVIKFGKAAAAVR